MPKPKQKMGVDPLCVDLAEHFLADVKGMTAMDVTELSEAIQTLCEDWCREFDEVE